MHSPCRKVSEKAARLEFSQSLAQGKACSVHLLRILSDSFVPHFSFEASALSLQLRSYSLLPSLQSHEIHHESAVRSKLLPGYDGLEDVLQIPPEQDSVMPHGSAFLKHQDALQVLPAPALLPVS